MMSFLKIKGHIMSYTCRSICSNVTDERLNCYIVSWRVFSCFTFENRNMEE